MGILEVISEVGVVVVIGVVVWLIRLEGVVKRNKEELERLSGIEQQTANQEVAIGKRDEEMRAMKRSFDDLRSRVEKMENQQMGMVTQLASIDAKLSLLIGAKKGDV